MRIDWHLFCFSKLIDTGIEGHLKGCKEFWPGRELVLERLVNPALWLQNS